MPKSPATDPDMTLPERPRPRRAAPASTWAWALAVALLLGCLFSLSGSKVRFGYEGPNQDQAEALLTGQWTPRAGGGIEPYTQSGIIEVAAYLPTAALRLALERQGRLPGLRQLAHVFVNPILTVALCLFFWGLALELFGSRSTANALTLILGTATMMWPYAKFGMETQQTLWTVAALWALARYARRPAAAPAAAFGVALGLLLLTKVTGLLNAAALVAGAACLWLARPRGLPAPPLRHALAAAGPALLGAAILLLTNRWRYGGWLWQGRYGFGAETRTYPFWEGLWAVAASPGKSIFLFNPPLLLALAWAGRFWRQLRMTRMGRPLGVAILCLALIALVHLRMRPWADETWGPRRLHYLVPILLLPIGAWWQARAGRTRQARAAAWLAIAAGVVVQLLAISFDYSIPAKLMGGTPVFSQEAIVWDPQFAAPRFNALLLAAKLRGEPAPEFVLRLNYLPVTMPPNPPPPVHYDLSRHARLDFWLLQQRADWPDRPYWFVSLSFWLWTALAAGAAAGAWRIARLARQ